MDCFKTALVFPWNSGVGVGGVYLPPPLYYLRTAFQQMGAIVTPSGILPFGILELLRNGAYKSPGNPLLLTARLSATVNLLCVPLPSSNMFLSVLAQACGSPPFLWLLLSAAAEFIVSSGLQPPPQSACLDPLLSFPDWVDLKSAPFVSATAPPSEVPSFLLRSGFLTYGAYGRWMSSVPAPAGSTRLLMGPCSYSDDIALLLQRPLVLPLLSAFVELPHAYLRGSAPGSFLAPGLFVDLLQLILLSIAVQLALPTVPVEDDDDYEEIQ